MQVGDNVKFGDYLWRVLKVEEDRVLIITEYIIEHRSYHDAYVPITWADSALRKYLNNDFIQRFSEEERSRIIPVINKNNDNNWYHTSGGEDTEDFVFLLSMEEAVCLYFGDSSSLLFNPRKTQRYWFERKDINNSRRIAKRVDNTNQVWWWWTRTPGRFNIKNVYIHGDGNIGIQGNNILKGNVADGKCTGGVRPAMWIYSF